MLFHSGVGDQVAEDDIICEIETDKVRIFLLSEILILFPNCFALNFFESR